MSRRVLVTGGSGFIGSHTVRRLVDEGYEVTVYDLAPPTDERHWVLKPVLERIRLERGSVTDPTTLVRAIRDSGAQHIVHTAALMNPLQSIAQPIPDFQVNVGGTLNVLEAARALGLERIIYMGSIGVFAPSRYEPMDEDHPVMTSRAGPITPYAASKLAAEAYGLNYCAYHEVDFISLRLSSVYGLGMRWPMYVKPIVENAARSLPTRFPSGGDMRRAFTYVKDVAHAVQATLEADGDHLTDRIFIIASERKPVSVREVAEVVKSIVPEVEVEVGPGLGEKLENEVKRRYMERAVMIRGELSLRRAKEQLGWSPKYPMRRGIEDYLDSFRRYLERHGREISG